MESFVPRSTEVRVQAAARILPANTLRAFLDILNKDASVAVKVKFGGDFTPAQSSVQNIAVSEAPTNGELLLALGETELAPITPDADAAGIQTILEGVVGAGNVAVTGSWAAGFVATFQGELENQPVPHLLVLGNTLQTNVHAQPETFSIAPVEAAASGALTLAMNGFPDLVLPYNATAADAQAASEALEIPWPCTFEGDLTTTLLLVFQYPGAPFPVTLKASSLLQAIADPTDEVQTIAFAPLPDAGAFVLGFGAEQTNRLPYNITAPQLQAELEALDAIGAGNVTVAGSVAAGFVVTFGGALAGLDQPSLYPVPISRVDHPFAGSFGLYMGAANYPSTHDVSIGVQETTAGSVAAPVQLVTGGQPSETLRDVEALLSVTTDGADGNEGTEILAGKRLTYDLDVPISEVWAKSEGAAVNLELTEG